MTKKAFLGTDVSFKTLDFSLNFETQPEKYFHLKVGNNQAGYKKLLQFLKQHQVDLENLIVIMEHTGVYMLQFICFLEEHNLKFALFPGLEIKRSLGITRGKNDKVDACRIAEYGFKNRHKLKPTQMPSSTILKLKQLLTTRQLLVRHRAAYKNAYKAQKMFSEVTQENAVLEQLKVQMSALNTSIEAIDKEMQALVGQCPEMKKNFDLLCSITGVGKVIAYSLIAYTNNFRSFITARQFMSYVGVAPFEDDSGERIKPKRISQLANKRLKALLHNGASSMKAHDPEAKAYYNRKITQGKHKRQVINALVAKLITRVFAVIKRGSPFVALYSQKIPQIKVA